MLNFIIYEDEIRLQKLYHEAILNFIGETSNPYTIHLFSNFNHLTVAKLKEITGMKFYILNIEVPGKSGLDLARAIRKSGDWESQIVLVSKYEFFKDLSLTGKIMALDYLSATSAHLDEDLKEAIRCAHDFFYCKKFVTFSIYGEIVHLPLKDILWIETDNVPNRCKIITKGRDFTTYRTLKSFEEELANEVQFFKSHRGCLVNVHNIRTVEYTGRRMIFGKKYTDRLSMRRRRYLKNILTQKIEAKEELPNLL